jgi:predicted transcriptional regulator
MKALWALGSANVHGIRGRIWASRPLAYTTIMTVMERLTRKGAAERRREGRYHVYRPLLSYAELRERAVTRLVDEFFLGSREALQRHLENRSAGKSTADQVSPELAENAAIHPAGPELQVELNGDTSPQAGDHEIDPTLL